MPYVDGFVIPVPVANLPVYKAFAERAAAIWREHGALEVRECVAEDAKPGQQTSFPQSVLLQDGETVVFSWIVFNSREERDAINKKVMEDPRLAELCTPDTMPFDGKRMVYGGFESIVHA